MPDPESTSAPRTARAIARAELTRQIKDTARSHLAETGAPGLSLRAVARELGMVSSALYRYFPSRDELLTALIIDAYDSVGAAAEAADAAVRRSDGRGRFRATGRAIRSWARANPHEYALVYGSPVPGYAAPEDTIGPATRAPLVLMRLLADASAAGRVTEPDHQPGLPASVRSDLARLAADAGLEIPPPALARGVLAWTALFGAVSFELFGQFVNVIDDTDAWFDHQLDRLTDLIGLQ